MNKKEYTSYSKTVPAILEENTVHPDYGWCRNFKGFIQYRELLDN